MNKDISLLPEEIPPKANMNNFSNQYLIINRTILELPENCNCVTTVKGVRITVNL